MSSTANSGAGVPTREPDGKPAPSADARRSLERAQWRQLILITLGAFAIFFGLRALPTGTNLSHMDFRASGTNSIEFCDPANPQFIPVVAVRSPVTTTLATTTPLQAGAPADCTIRLRTTAGDKPIAPEDLAVVHTQKMHLLITDPSLTDYQHVHPTPGKKPGEWHFTFTPRFGGTYRIFADFTPVATGRGLYASVDANVAGPVSDPTQAPSAANSVGQVSDLTKAIPSAAAARPNDPTPPPVSAVQSGQVKDLTYSTDGYRFTLTPAAMPLRARQPIDLKFRIQSAAGAAVPMQPVMGAFAHLVAFDAARSGFAHLHPAELDLSKPPDAVHPELNFKLTIPRAGRYVIWAQVNLGGRELFVPFWFDVIA